MPSPPPRHPHVLPILTTSADGAREWRLADGTLHREDGPAVEWPNGDYRWYFAGKPHRDDGPAYVRHHHVSEWWIHGKLHRTGAAAVERGDGGLAWYQYGVLHRLDGPAVWHPSGDTEWWVSGQRHRDGGPAIEFADGLREWYQHDALHREEGPAVEYQDGSTEWHVRGRPAPPLLCALLAAGLPLTIAAGPTGWHTETAWHGVFATLPLTTQRHLLLTALATPRVASGHVPAVREGILRLLGRLPTSTQAPEPSPIVSRVPAKTVALAPPGAAQPLARRTRGSGHSSSAR